MVPDVSRYSGTSNLKFPPQVVVNADVCLQFASPASLGFISRSFIVSHTGEFPTPPKKKTTHGQRQITIPGYDERVFVLNDNTTSIHLFRCFCLSFSLFVFCFVYYDEGINSPAL